MLQLPERRTHFWPVASRFLREPLFHFFIIGGLIFAIHAWVPTTNGGTDRDRIVVTSGRIEQLAQVFAKTWQRSPTASELQGLVDAFVQEEVYYREAIKLGLDRDDTLVRRRMQQKMEFLTEPGDDVLTTTDTQLEAYLKANLATFQVAPKLAFEQIFINPQASGEPAAVRAQNILSSLRAAPAAVDTATLGDGTLLNHTNPLTSITGIARSLGPAFAEALTRIPREEWTGPIPSSFGFHLVRVTAYREAYTPPLAEIRDAVLLKWRAEQRDAFMAGAYQRLRKQYEVILPSEGEQAAEIGGMR